MQKEHAKGVLSANGTRAHGRGTEAPVRCIGVKRQLLPTYYMYPPPLLYCNFFARMI